MILLGENDLKGELFLGENQFALVIKDHVTKSRSVNKHPAKLLILSSLLKELFGANLKELIPGIETELGSKLRGLGKC